MRRLVTIDLGRADLALFEAYEAAVLPLLARHGGRIEMRVRAADDSREVHLLHFPDETALSRFLADPDRIAHRAVWERSGATAEVIAVETISS